jgi:activating signal cointegrator complex subunit 1
MSGETGRRPPPGFESSNLESNSTTLKPYEEDDDYCDPDAPEDSEIADKFVVEKLESGGFKTRCDDIPSSLYSVIVGAKASTKKRLETETQTKIIIPPQNQKGDIVIRGQHRKDVITARRRVDFLASRARFQRDATHFVCFPVASKTIVDNVQKFQKLVAEDYATSPFATFFPKIFQEPQKLHLTICVLVLLDAKERKLVTDLLDNLKPIIIKKLEEDASEGKCKIHLKGIEIMNDDPSQADVLYAKCNLNSQTIQQIADLLNEKFEETGLAKRSKSNNVKLHVTLMNTRFLSIAEEGSSVDKDPHKHKRMSFDARPILESEKYLNFDFGVADLKEIHVSVRYTSNPKDGFYNSSARINLS